MHSSEDFQNKYSKTEFACLPSFLQSSLVVKQDVVTVGTQLMDIYLMRFVRLM